MTDKGPNAAGNTQGRVGPGRQEIAPADAGIRCDLRPVIFGDGHRSIGIRREMRIVRRCPPVSKDPFRSSRQGVVRTSQIKSWASAGDGDVGEGVPKVAAGTVHRFRAVDASRHVSHVVS